MLKNIKIVKMGRLSMKKYTKIAFLMVLVSQTVATIAMEQKILDQSEYRTADNKYACNYLDCGKTYMRFVNLRAHIESVHLKIIYSCPLCHEEFRAERSYNKHCKELHGCYLCNLCQKRFDVAENVRQHREVDHNKANQCGDDNDGKYSCTFPTCKKKLKSNRTYRQHCQKKHRGFWCDRCKKLCEKYVEYKYHMQGNLCEIYAVNRQNSKSRDNSSEKRKRISSEADRSINYENSDSIENSAENENLPQIKRIKTLYDSELLAMDTENPTFLAHALEKQKSENTLEELEEIFGLSSKELEKVFGLPGLL